ncbi:OmpP1/FadL family transporter [Propionivibrio dicarboxylicus]|uniref:Long-chain fatty acid transport protein n=1 Tax=Propionivibrio dicarboxylicus TaxID=83767 RepID=A0A1G8MXL1_9RHOO|nr:outer membrane protein transport protein [Propionivibrio dicarboxylicus]SDI72769.1 long-chain fatty acid transport protein [Propionivibrio dicarboxylicus]
MAKSISMKVAMVLLPGVISGTAVASGFQLLEQSASGIGNAFAGSAAVAENASTVYFNPAGMTQLQGVQLSGGVAAVNPSFTFSDKNSSVGSLAGTGNGGNAGGWVGIPNGYASWGVSKDLFVGLGISAPFGLKTEYTNRWLGAAQSIKFDIKTLNINPSVAYKVSDNLSIGGGLNWQKIEAEYVRAAATTSAGAAAVNSTMNLSDSAWGWNAGALFTVSPSTKVGLSYRSQVKYHTTGDVKLASDGSAAGNATLAALVAAGRQSDLKADLTVPDTLIMSVTQKLSDKWEMLGDVSRTGWSSIPKVDIMRTSGTLNGLLAQSLGTEFRNTWRVALGANYQYSQEWKLKFGIAYDQSPVKGATTRLTSLPDNDRIWLSTGAQWTLSKAAKVDLGLTYIHVKKSEINNNQTADGRGLVSGDYTGSIWIVGAQYSHAF